jgi:hypothetical protein
MKKLLPTNVTKLSNEIQRNRVRPSGLAVLPKPQLLCYYSCGWEFMKG